MLKKIIVVSLIAILFCVPAFSYEWQKGICYTTWTKDKYVSPASDESLKTLRGTGATWVSVLTTWYQDSCHDTDIHPTDKTPSDESIVHAIKEAHSLGMKVMIKPHLDIIDTSDGSWRGDIGCKLDTDLDAWFESYKNFIVHYAVLAEENKAEMLCIGTELTSISAMREDKWRDVVIKSVREVYKGPLTYASNWNDEYGHIKFWDALDYVGIDAYYPIVEDKAVPTLEEIKKGWEPWVKDIEEFQKRVNKPIIFPEVGYCSADWTAKTPWEDLTGNTNVKLQEDCYEALLETFWDKEWFYGLYWWRWGTNKNFGGPNNRGYVFQNKPAQKIVEKWYKKHTPTKLKY
ncbi:MAG: glycoside hydrolase [Candidatus Omnitrophota bacterium]|jgi:hypothetical protein